MDMSMDFRNGDESFSRVPADSAIFSKISFLDTSRSNNSCLVHIRRKDVPIIRIIFHWWHDPDNWSRHDRISVDGLPPLRFNVTNLISKGEACLNPQTWPETLARPRLRAHPIILQWYKFYGSFLWYPILSLQQRFPFLSFFHNRILRGEYKFEDKFLMKFESRVIQSMTRHLCSICDREE